MKRIPWLTAAPEAPEPPFPSFEACLAAEPPDAAVDDPVARLNDALALCRSYLNRTEYLVGYGPRALYHLLDTLADAIKANRPESLCRSGCSGCCTMNKAFIRIYRSEWQPMEAAIRARGAEEVARFTERFHRVYGPYLPALRQWQARLEAGEPGNPTREEFPVDCPMLEDRKCLAYAMRPAICRAFGHFALSTTAEDGKIYACEDQQEVLAPGTAEGKPTAMLPSFTPFYKRVEALTDGQEKQLIPLWIARAFPLDAS